ncbi:3672_t:CDS:2, partial [Racocetra fulgida]
MNSENQNIETSSTSDKKEYVISSKRKQLKANSIAATNSVAATNSNQSDLYNMDLDHDSDSFEDLPLDFLHEDNVQIDQNIENVDEFINNDGLLYNLDEVEELISIDFKMLKNQMNSDLIESIFPESWLDTHDFETIKGSFHQLISVVVLPLEYRSCYYWNVSKIYPNKRMNKFTGCVTAYLECAQHDDRDWQRSNNQPIKRVSEARAPIERYSCFGKIKLTIDPQKRCIIVQGSHQLAHKHPEYRKVEFPVAAKL